MNEDNKKVMVPNEPPKLEIPIVSITNEKDFNYADEEEKEKTKAMMLDNIDYYLENPVFPPEENSKKDFLEDKPKQLTLKPNDNNRGFVDIIILICLTIAGISLVSFFTYYLILR